MSFEHDKRVIIYPDYINAKRTVSQGRKVPVPEGGPLWSLIRDLWNTGLHVPLRAPWHKANTSGNKDINAVSPLQPARTPPFKRFWTVSSTTTSLQSLRWALPSALL